MRIIGRWQFFFCEDGWIVARGVRVVLSAPWPTASTARRFIRVLR
jgi:hypothetical protein